MENILRQTTALALHAASAYIKPGDVLIDAACGNGHDTLFLAGTMPSRLYAFDIQQEALNSTRSLLISEGFEDKLRDGTISLINDSHENMAAYVPGGADVILFNLGYLPGGRKDITTKSETTVSAVHAALDILKKDGLLCITMYSGHPEGRREKAALLAMASSLDHRKYHAAFTDMINQKNDPPSLLLITRKL